MELLPRAFVQVAEGESSLTVMQWNMLADQLANDFPAVNDETLSWNFRSPRILIEIERFSPDILCAEEVDHYADFLEPELRRLGYSGFFEKKPSWHRDGSAIFYKVNRFTAISNEVCQFEGRNQFALGTKLLDTWTNKEVYVYALHLKANKAYEDVRVNQIRSLLRHLEPIDNTKSLIVCGDFNSLPENPAHLEMLNNQLGLRSAYRGIFSEGEVPYTTVKIRASLEKKTEDYIWLRGFEIQSVLSIPSLEEIGPNGLPSPHYPSDHLSLAIRLI